MSCKHITFIGGGNMAQSLIAGVCASGYSGEYLSVSDPDENKLAKLAAEYQLAIYHDNLQAVQSADIIVLAVKPNNISKVCQEIVAIVQQRHPLVISIAAGISLQQLTQWLGAKAAIIRVMPNTPSQVLHGVSGLTANSHVTTEQHAAAENLFKTVGLTAWFTDENLLHAVTALSGSGPAYYFLFMEALAAAAVDLGLPPEIAKNFSIQTAWGAAKLAANSTQSLENLRAQVTSPNGTTAKAIQTFEEGNIRELIRKAVFAAYERSIEMSKKGNT